MKKALLFTLFLASACNNVDAKENHRFIPRKLLFGNPDILNVALSPDGKYLSYISSLDGVLNIFVAPSDNLSEVKPVTFDKGQGIRSYTWSYAPTQLIYEQDTNGDENTILYHLNVSKKMAYAFTPKKVKAYLLPMNDLKKDDVVFATNERDPHYFDIYNFNLKTQKKSLLYKNNEYVHLIFDKKSNLRFAVKILPNGDIQIDQFLNKKMEPFKIVAFDDADTTRLIGLNSAGNKLFMLDSSNIDKAALYEIDLNKKETRMLGSSKQVDIRKVITHPKTDEIQAYITEYDREKIEIIDKNIQDDINYLMTLSDGTLSILSRTLDDTLWIVAYRKDNSPAKYYKYDRKNKKADFLFVSQSKLASYDLNKMYPVIIKTRDGLAMMSYLSLPKDVKFDPNTVATSKALPLILVVHGGPTSRDYWGFNSHHQWLTNRGYAVLSINYRGSSGFGKRFIRAGDGEWAQKMQKDLLDAVDWAVAKGITSKEQVAIFGGSYGGYAVLAGLSMVPDVFTCGVEIAGPSNLKTLYESIPPYWVPMRIALRRMLGLTPIKISTSADDANFSVQSPITYIENIKKPILIAHGENDPRVNKAEAEQLVAKLEQKKIPYTYLRYPNEGHGLIRPENRASFYAIAEEFLASCFNKAYEPVGSDLKGSSVVIKRGVF